MTIKDLQRQLNIIKEDRYIGSHHDDIFFQVQNDIEAMDSVINLIKFLSDKNPADNLTVAEVLAAGNIEI